MVHAEQAMLQRSQQRVPAAIAKKISGVHIAQDWWNGTVCEANRN
jgi:hypothetical protein